MRAPVLAAMLLAPLAASAHTALDPALDVLTEVPGRLLPMEEAVVEGPIDVAAGLPDGRVALASDGLLRVLGPSGEAWRAAVPLAGTPTRMTTSRTAIAVDVPDNQATFHQRWAVFDLAGTYLYTAQWPEVDPVEYRTYAADETGSWVVHQTTATGPRQDSVIHRSPSGQFRWEHFLTPTQFVFRVQPLGQGWAGLAVYTNTTHAVDVRVLDAQGALRAVHVLTEDGGGAVRLPYLAQAADGSLLAAQAKGHDDSSVAVGILSPSLAFQRGHAHGLRGETLTAGLAAMPGGVAVAVTRDLFLSPPVTLPAVLRFACGEEGCDLAWSRTLTENGVALAAAPLPDGVALLRPGALALLREA